MWWITYTTMSEQIPANKTKIKWTEQIGRKQKRVCLEPMVPCVQRGPYYYPVDPKIVIADLTKWWNWNWSPFKHTCHWITLDDRNLLIWILKANMGPTSLCKIHYPFSWTSPRVTWLQFIFEVITCQTRKIYF